MDCLTDLNTRTACINETNGGHISVTTTQLLSNVLMTRLKRFQYFLVIGGKEEMFSREIMAGSDRPLFLLK